MDAAGMAFAMIDLRKITGLTANFIAHDFCLGFDFDASRFHFRFPLSVEDSSSLRLLLSLVLTCPLQQASLAQMSRDVASVEDHMRCCGSAFTAKTHLGRHAASPLCLAMTLLATPVLILRIPLDWNCSSRYTYNARAWVFNLPNCINGVLQVPGDRLKKRGRDLLLCGNRLEKGAAFLACCYD
jgi:hypothetical protein